MKIGTCLTLFDSNWKIFQPLFTTPFHHFELLPENCDTASLTALLKHIKHKEILLHAPFTEANLIACSSVIRNASVDYYVGVLRSLVKQYVPAVVTTHMGQHPFFQKNIPLDSFRQLSSVFPTVTFENQPYRSNIWRQSYPNTEEETDNLLTIIKNNMTFDVGHWILGGFDVYRLLEKYLPRITDIHIHDVVGQQDHQPLGTGVLDVEKFISILQKQTYKKYLTIELVSDDIKGILSSFKIVQKLLRHA